MQGSVGFDTANNLVFGKVFYEQIISLEYRLN